MERSIVNVARFLPLQARENPAEIAVRVPRGRSGQVLHYTERTFAELDGESDACARLLLERGIGRGTRTLLMVRPGLELILCCFALFKAGAVPVVIDPGVGLKSFRACVRRTRPEALVGVPLAHRVASWFRKDFRSVRHRLRVDGKGFWQSIRRNQNPQPFGLTPTGEDELAAILFTSGSTGAPKGVRYTHGMFEAQVRLLKELYDIRPGEVDLPMLPVFALFNPALGMMTVVPEMNPSRPAKASPAKIVQAIRQNRVTNSFGSPVLWTKIADWCEREDVTLPSLKRILMAGASVPPSLIQRMRKVAPAAVVHTPYGATECLPLASISGPEVLGELAERSRLGGGSCVGWPAPEVELRCIPVTDAVLPDFDPQQALPPGELGEIVACGPVVTREYDALPEATAAAKMRDAQGRTWHRMGDLGYIDDEGRLWFCGRKAERVECEAGVFHTDPCEAVFNVHPDVRRTALLGVRRDGRTVPAIAVEPLPGKFPRGAKAKTNLIEELKLLGSQHAHTEAIDLFFFERSFPVDVRHNAKIHRLSLARKHSGKA